MDQGLNAAIVSSDLEPAVLQRLVKALKAAGFHKVSVLREMPPLGGTASASDTGIRLPKPLAQCRLIVLDQTVAGRSAFELLPLLKAPYAAWATAFGLLLDPAAGADTLTAAWLAGFDLVLGKPVDPAVFAQLAARVRQEGGGGPSDAVA